MKKTTVLMSMFAAMLLASCGGGSGDAGQEVCDCYKKANGMKADDPKRAEEQGKCVELQGEKWEEIKDDMEKVKEFNQKIADCSKEMRNEALSAE